jgi:hypothetical protein
MDVLSDKKVTRLVASQGMTRVYELEDNVQVQAQTSQQTQQQAPETVQPSGPTIPR